MQNFGVALQGQGFVNLSVGRIMSKPCMLAGTTMVLAPVSADFCSVRLSSGCRYSLVSVSLLISFALAIPSARMASISSLLRWISTVICLASRRF